LPKSVSDGSDHSHPLKGPQLGRHGEPVAFGDLFQLSKSDSWVFPYPSK
jgi:hypothetical protein